MDTTPAKSSSQKTKVAIAQSMEPLVEVPAFDEHSRKNQSILISTDVVGPPSGRDFYRGKSGFLDNSEDRAGIITSKSHDMNLIQTNSGCVDEEAVSSNTQAISFENEGMVVLGGGQSPNANSATRQQHSLSRKQSTFVTGMVQIMSTPIEEINEDLSKFIGNLKLDS